MNEQEYIDRTIEFVKEKLEGAEAGHDWWHIERVYRNSLLIAQTEQVDSLVVSLAALLHDIADSKFHDGDETLGPKIAEEFLGSLGLNEATILKVVDIIRNISFKNSLSRVKISPKSEEFKVVQDADRLDAIGAIGIARAFNYGGFKNRIFYDPEIKPNLGMTKEEYKKSNAPTINHFYEKLLILKEQMNTQTARILAEERHDFMLEFLNRFFQEWKGESFNKS